MGTLSEVTLAFAAVLVILFMFGFVSKNEQRFDDFTEKLVNSSKSLLKSTKTVQISTIKSDFTTTVSTTTITTKRYKSIQKYNISKTKTDLPRIFHDRKTHLQNVCKKNALSMRIKTKPVSLFRENFLNFLDEKSIFMYLHLYQ